MHDKTVSLQKPAAVLTLACAVLFKRTQATETRREWNPPAGSFVSHGGTRRRERERRRRRRGKERGNIGPRAKPTDKPR